jgi:hypothetical protein
VWRCKPLLWHQQHDTNQHGFNSLRYTDLSYHGQIFQHSRQSKTACWNPNSRFRNTRKSSITYIRPLLEYNSVVWNPYKNEQYISLIEKVQRRFNKRLPSLHLLSHSERLAMLNLKPLELRRLRFDHVMYYKILQGLMSVDVSSHFSIIIRQFHLAAEIIN